MTREKAIKISKALDAIDTFEIFMDRIEQVFVEEGLDVPDFGPVEDEIRQVMQKEYERRKKVLEEID